MKKAIILILFLYQVICDAQIELIQNGSFDMYEPVGLISNSNPVLPCKWGEFAKVNLNYPGFAGIATVDWDPEFEWKGFGTASNNNAADDPDLFDSRYICLTDNCGGGNYTGNCNLDINKVGIPSNFYGVQYHRQPIQQGGFGRYVGIYSGWFANNLYGIALGREKGIKIKLKKSLKCGFVYTLKFYAVKKRGNREDLRIRFGTGDDWNDGVILNGDDNTIEVAITNNGGPNNDVWQLYEVDFYVDEPDVQWLFIRAPRVPSPTHNSYILLDDVSLLDQCAIDFACDATLNAPTDEITCNNLHNGTQPLTFFNTESSKNIKIEIFPLYQNTPIRTIEITDPCPNIAWDGKNENGALVANTVYRYKITYGAACSCRTLEANFVKSGNPEIFNVTYGTEQSSGALTFYNLDNVHEFQIFIKNPNGDILYSKTLFNPPSSIYWNGLDDAGNPIGNVPAQTGCGSPSALRFDLTVRNNCGSKFYSSTFLQYCHDENLTSNHSDFYYTPLPKPLDECEYSFEYTSCAKAPIECCAEEIDLFLSNVVIRGEQEFRLIRDIQAGPKVVIETNSDIKFLAGREIRLVEDFYTEPGAEFLARIEDCERSEMENSPMIVTHFSNFPDVTTEHSVKVNIDSASVLKVFPNPTNHDLYIRSEIQIKTIAVYDLTGKIILSDSYTDKTDFVKLNTSSLLNGVYIIQIKLEDESVEVRKVIKQ